MNRRALAVGASLLLLAACGATATPTGNQPATVTVTAGGGDLSPACERALDLADEVVVDLATTGSDLLDVIRALTADMPVTAAGLLDDAQVDLDANLDTNTDRKSAADACRAGN